MSYSLELEFKDLPKTTNGSHGHWRTAAGERKKWRNRVSMVAYYLRPKTGPLTKARLICTRFSSSRPDRDNLAISFKSPVDGLVDAKVLANDTDEVIVECFYKWEKAPHGEGKIRLRVEEITA